MAGETQTEIIITDPLFIASTGGNFNLGSIIDDTSDSNFEDLGQQPDDVNVGGSVLDVAGNIATKLNSIASSRIRMLKLDFIISQGFGQAAHDYFTGKTGFVAVNRPITIAAKASGVQMSGVMTINRKINGVSYVYAFSNIIIKKVETTILQKGGDGSDGKKFTVTFEVVSVL